MSRSAVDFFKDLFGGVDVKSSLSSRHWIPSRKGVFLSAGMAQKD